MSNVSTAYDAILTALTALFSSKTRIPNVYSLPDNMDIFLRDGYGLRVDPTTPNPSEFCNFSRTHNFSIVLTKEVLRTESDFDVYDTTSKALLEDAYILQKDFLNVDQLGQYDSIELINFVGASGIDEVITEQSNFVTMEITFSLQITDLL